MTRGSKQWVTIMTVALLMGVAAVLVGVRVNRREKTQGGEGGDRLRPPSFVANDAAARSSSRDEIPVEQMVKNVMAAWRNAIIVKDPEMVLDLDHEFLSHPGRYLAPLMESAETDDESRVRSFSTKVLGKIAATESTPVLMRLLEDKNEFVRENAAWALGEIAARRNAKPLVRPAGETLDRLKRKDPNENVRKAAGEALDKVM